MNADYTVRLITKVEFMKHGTWWPQIMEREITAYELMELQSPEWPWLMLATIGFVGCGLISPIFALFYGEIFHVRACSKFSNPHDNLRT